MSLSLYIHWPYCLQKCPYCDFNVHLAQTVDEDAFLNALKTELSYYATHIEKQVLGSVFFGGGTPSLMHPKTVASILTHAESLFGFEPAIEISLEANPTSTENAKLQAFKQAGINRLSLGVQSLNEGELKKLGRTHTVFEAQKAIETIQAIFSNFSFDLIYARPDQTLEDWQAELENALKFNPPHVSLYQLTIEPNTQFYTLAKTGRLHAPTDEKAADLYELTQTIMTKAGMPAYEISNHAKTGFECRHNLNYWNGGDYIGIGPGAHGRLTLNGTRTATTAHRAPEKWLALVHEKQCGAHAFEHLTPIQQLEEQLMFGLRLVEGLKNPPLQNLKAAALSQLVEHGFLNHTPTHLKATAKGRLVLGAIINKLLP